MRAARDRPPAPALAAAGLHITHGWAAMHCSVLGPAACTCSAGLSEGLSESEHSSAARPAPPAVASARRELAQFHATTGRHNGAGASSTVVELGRQPQVTKSTSLGLPVRGNVPGQAGDIPGPPGIFPPETGNVPLTPLSSDPSGISPAGGNIPSPIGNIPGRRGYPPAHREYPRPAGISPARSVISRKRRASRTGGAAR